MIDRRHGLCKTSVQEDPTQPMPATVSVVVPVHEDTPPLRGCLTGLRDTKPSADEIILVADGRVEGLQELAIGYDARLVELQQRRGPSRARNAGARAARGDILLFIDADVAVPSDAIQQVSTAFETDPKLAAVFGSYGDSPPEPNLLSQYKNLLHHHVHQSSPDTVSSFWAGCGAIRRDVFLEAGGFDERYERPAIEDIELGHRISKAGHRSRLLKSLQCTHLKRWSAVSLLRSDFRDRALPWTRLLLREGTLPNHLNLHWANRFCVALVLTLIVCVVAAPWRPAAAGLLAAVCVSGLLILDRPLWLFFLRKRGLWFSLRILPWHWFHYAYSGLAFALGAALHLLSATTEGTSESLPYPVLPQGRER